MLPSLSELENAAQIVARYMPPTPQYRWPLLEERLGVETWIKHENHTPLGAFKVRGGLVYFDHLHKELARSPGVVCATRGNHGQSIAFAAAKYGIPATIVVPHGNSVEKNAAMRGLGAKLVEYGDDFQAALEHAESLSIKSGLVLVPSFHALLVAGVGTYCLELFRAVPDLDMLFIPIGLGSGICGAIAAKKALGLKTEIVGVVSTEARAYSESLIRGKPVDCPATTQIADGMACRRPNPDALAIIGSEVSRIAEVSDDEVREAIRDLFECTHNAAEGAGAAAVAAIKKERDLLRGKRVAAVLCGSNIDSKVLSAVLSAKEHG